MTQRIGFLGPVGTFAEEALLTQKDLANSELIPFTSMPEVLAATERGEIDLGFVALENSIEGTVNASLDALIFERSLFIQREVILPVRMNLMAKSGVKIKDIKKVVSFPHAAAQCRGFLDEKLPGVEVIASNSTADAAREIGESNSSDTAAIANSLAAELYGLKVLAEDIEDHDDNATRFVLVAKQGISAPTGHDKTTVVIFQQADKPGSLQSILGEFAARSINLSKLESRPTKSSLGSYCFIVDFEGHIADELIADCLKALHAQLEDIKFLGSYPSAGEDGAEIRAEISKSWHAAESWVDDLRKEIRE